MTPRQFDNTVQGYQDQERRKWERSRWVVQWLIQPHVDKNGTAAVERAMRFPWEESKAKQTNTAPKNGDWYVPDDMAGDVLEKLLM